MSSYNRQNQNKKNHGWTNAQHGRPKENPVVLVVVGAHAQVLLFSSTTNTLVSYSQEEGALSLSPSPLRGRPCHRRRRTDDRRGGTGRNTHAAVQFLPGNEGRQYDQLRYRPWDGGLVYCTIVLVVTSSLSNQYPPLPSWVEWYSRSRSPSYQTNDGSGDIGHGVYLCCLVE